MVNDGEATTTTTATTTRRAALLAAPAILGLAGAARGQGAAFPSRPLRMLIPFPPGGGSDILGRIVAQRMADALGGPVVPENRGGAGGNIGTDAAAKSPPDGYTLLIAFNTVVVNQFLYRQLPFDFRRDFAPVARVALVPTVIAAGPKMRAGATLADVVAETRARPGALNHGTPGIGTITHVSAELMDAQTGGRLTHVHYRGTGPAVTAAASGEVELVSAPWSAVEGLVSSGRLRVLANIAGARSPLIPDVPTVAEAANLPDYAVDTWGGIFVPAATPPAVVARLAEAVRAAVDTEEGRAALASRGFQAAYADGPALARVVEADMARWEPVLRAANIQVE